MGIADLVNDKEIWYDVFNGDLMIQSTRNKSQANRRVFAENCSYRKKADQTWHVKERDTNNADIYYMKGKQ